MRRRVKDRNGNTFYINELPQEESCIIPNAEHVVREDTLDDSVNDWNQLY